MIKRRFFKHEHGDKDAPSDSSSSSSSDDSESEVELQSDNEDNDDNVAVAQVKQSNVPCSSSSSSSGYESEESSAHEVDLDSPGLPSSEDDLVPADKGEDVGVTHLLEKKKLGISDKLYSAGAEKDENLSDLPSCVLKIKSVFKCKICPRIICLTEEILRTHLKSKRHARSEKLLSEGRLKIMLNSDGELEAPFEEEETHQERHAATLAAAAAAAAQASQNSTKAMKKNKGRQRQRMRSKKKTGEDATSTNAKATKRPPKKRRQN